MANTNCLEGIRCPKCLQEDRFRISGETIFDVNDSGSEADGAHEWGDESYTWCTGCDAEGPLAEFTIANQEPLSRCQNCEWFGIPKIGLAEIPDLTQRIMPGEPVPSGECSDCGALCHEATAEEIAVEEDDDE